MSAANDAAATGRSGGVLLGIYLNDHLAGATAGLDLFRRAADAQRDSAAGDVLRLLAAEVAEDREALLQMMSALGVPVRRYKVYAARAAERLGRLKLNGQVRGRSPLSGIVELEAMRLGVEGKAAGWRSLRELAGAGPLDPVRLDELLERARLQSESLEGLRVGAVRQAFQSA
jgi:hypothetical protein